MTRLLVFITVCTALIAAASARAEPEDVDAAARGVVRVVVIGSDGEEIFPVSHGTGFAVSRNRIVTNAHVVREALEDEELRIGIVPSEGGEAVYGKAVAVSARIDLAIIETTGALQLTPLVIATGDVADSGGVAAVGYPMNVDQAQGLEIGDIFRSQPPVKARGFLSGFRPSRQFDTILHTAPIARGNSGGPLLDECGRVIGVNSFGADAGGSDAEFFFAVSARELIPFLRQNGVTFQANALPCRSMAELDTAERERLAREAEMARGREAAARQAAAQTREQAQVQAALEILVARENHMAGAFVLLLLGAGAGAYAFSVRKEGIRSKPVVIGAGVAALALAGAIIAWLSRPGIAAVDERVAQLLAPVQSGPAPGRVDDTANLVCQIDLDRSRITGSVPGDIGLAWSPQGCINARTQYGLSEGRWSRVLVPAQDNAVTVNQFDPDSRIFRADRYLLSRPAMLNAREARAKYTAPACGTADAADALGEAQASVIAQLPARPNERLVFRCLDE